MFLKSLEFFEIRNPTMVDKILQRKIPDIPKSSNN